MTQALADALRNEVEEAAAAHTDLNIFAAVQALMEHSLVDNKRTGTMSLIIKICLREQQRCLHDYDRAVARAVARAVKAAMEGK